MSHDAPLKVSGGDTDDCSAPELKNDDLELLSAENVSQVVFKQSFAGVQAQREELTTLPKPPTRIGWSSSPNVGWRLTPLTIALPSNRMRRDVHCKSIHGQ